MPFNKFVLKLKFLFSSGLYESPPSERHTVLLLVGWTSVL